MSEIKTLNGYSIVDTGARERINALKDEVKGLRDYLNPVPHLSNYWSIHQNDFWALEHNSKTPVRAYLDKRFHAFGAMNIHPGRMVYRDGTVDALFQKCTYMFSVVSVGEFAFGTRDGNGENQGVRCVVNPANRTFKIYHSDWMHQDEIKRNLMLDFQILTNEIYIAEIEKFGMHQVTVRLSCMTDANKRFEYVHTAAGEMYNNKIRCWGGVAFKAVASNAEFKLLEMAQKIYVDDTYDLLIIGDSFVECATIEMESNKGFAYLARERMGAKCSASGHGGATTAQVITRLKTDADIGVFKYALLQIGSNDSVTGVSLEQYKKNMREIIAFVEDRGAIPILATIPIRTDIDNAAFAKEANEWIRMLGYKYVDEYDILTSDHLLSDGIHPNETGHMLIFLSLRGLIPECF